MTKRKKNKSPARVRYEKSHPVISFRVDKELYDKLQEVRKTEGKSNTDVMRTGVGLMEVKVRSEEEIWQEAYHKGQLNGYELAESEYKTTYLCSICRKPIEVTTDKEKRAIATYMRENGWGHEECYERTHRS